MVGMEGRMTTTKPMAITHSLAIRKNINEPNEPTIHKKDRKKIAIFFNVLLIIMENYVLN